MRLHTNVAMQAIRDFVFELLDYPLIHQISLRPTSMSFPYLRKGLKFSFNEEEMQVVGALFVGH